MTRGLKPDPSLVRTMTVVEELNRSRAVQCAHSQVGPGQRHGSDCGGWGQPGLTGSGAGCRGSECARRMTEEHCSGSGTGPGHSLEGSGSEARQQRVWHGAQLRLGARARACSRGGNEGEGREQGENMAGLTVVQGAGDGGVGAAVAQGTGGWGG